MTEDSVSLEFLKRRMAELETLQDKRAGRRTRGSPPEGPGMRDERIGKLEGAIEGLRHAQNLTVGVVAVFAAVMIGLMVYTLQRIDQLSDRVADLPGKISADMRDLTKTLADTITAARQPAPLPSLPQLAPQPEQKPPAPMFQKHEKEGR
jgi:hypothetical protein